MNAVKVYVNFEPSLMSDAWLANYDELVSELKKLMPDVKRYTMRGFKKYKWYKIEDIVRCYDSEIPGAVDECKIIELEVIPKNL